MLSEKTEGAIKNGQSRETGNVGHTRHRTKTYKTQHWTLKRLATRTLPNTGGKTHGPYQIPGVKHTDPTKYRGENNNIDPTKYRG